MLLSDFEQSCLCACLCVCVHVSECGIPLPSGSSRSGVTVAVMSGQTAYAEMTRAPGAEQRESQVKTRHTQKRTYTHTNTQNDSTWSFDRLLPNSCSHTQRVLAAINGHAQLTHDLTHGFTGFPQTGPLTGQFGSPHPVTATLHILKHTTRRSLNPWTLL